MTTRLLSPQDYVKAIVQRKWLIIACVLGAVAIAWVACLVLPKTYRSSTLILAEEQKVLNVKGVESSRSDGATDRVAMMQARTTVMKQILYSRELLAKVAAELQLYGYDAAKAGSPFEDVVFGKMRAATKIELARDQSFLTLSFSDESPTIARDVTMRLADYFIQESSRSKEEIAEASTEFLQHELDTLREQLEVKEKALAEFKRLNLGELPEQMESNLRALDRLEAEQTTQTELHKSLMMRASSLDKAIRDYEEQGVSADGNPRKMRDMRLARIKELERQLLGLMAIYKENYPDIVQIKEEIKKLKAISTEDYAGQNSEADEPVVIKKRGKGRAIDSYHADLMRQREDIDEQLEMIKVKQVRIASEMQRYQSRVDRAPAHKQKQAALERDFENLQKQFQLLSEKKTTAALAGDMERRKKGSMFRIVDPANLPSLPEKPNVPFILLGGLGIGCALGFGGAIGLELLRRGFFSAEEVEIALGLPVLVTIPQYESALGGVPGKSQGFISRRPGATPLLQAGKRSERLLPHYGGNEVHPAAGQSSLGARPLSRLAPGLELVTMWRPRSLVAEQFRVAATRLELMAGERKSTVIVLTSSLMGEGKSCTSLNLAHVLARDLDKGTVLVDCDLKRPMQHVYAGVESHPGLAEVLHGEKSLDDCLHKPEGLGFSILPAGSVSDGPPALSKMQQVADLISDLRERFEYIVVDAPPILPLADMNVLASMADIVLMVIRAGATGRDAVQKALKTIGDPGPISVVLNGLEVQDTPYYMQQMYYHESHHEQLK
ncbi:MAG: AAA family ATPase [Nitrospiraceae bacterium]